MKNVKRAVSSLRRLKSSQSVMLCFKLDDGMIGLARLRDLVNENNEVRVPFLDKSIMNAGIVGGQWGIRKYRTYQVYGLINISDDLLYCILEYVDTIIGYHGMKEFTSGGKKYQREFVQLLSNLVFNPIFIIEISRRCVSIKASLSKMEDGTPAIKFDLFMNNKILSSLILDGFTGRIAKDGVFCNDVYISSTQFQVMIIDTIDKILDVKC